MDNEDYGIVFSGGGALGAWEVGCYEAIRSYHRDRLPHVVTGASAGAINAAGVCAGMHPSQLVDFWLKLKQKDIYKNNFGWLTFFAFMTTHFSVKKSIMRFLEKEKSLYKTSPLEKTLWEIFEPCYNTFTQSEIRYALSVTNLTHNRREIFYKLPPSETLPKAAQAGHLAGSWTGIRNCTMLIQALMGSTALPILFPPFEHYFDGGVLLNQPITPAIALGAINRLYVIIPSPEALGVTNNLRAIASTLLIAWLSASMIAQIDNVKLRNIIRSKSGDPQIRLCLIRPSMNLTSLFDVTMLSFGKNVTDMVKHGKDAAQARLNLFDPNNAATWY